MESVPKINHSSIHRVLLICATALAIGLLVSPVVTHGQSPALSDAYERFSELYAEGRYAEALPFAKEAVRLGEHEFGPEHPTTATYLNNLATLYQGQGEHAAAEPLFKRALAIWETTLGPEHP